MSKPRLEGKVAIITGAASGIGEAAAKLFAANGATVVIADIQDELGAAVAASIGPDRCSYKHCDVTDERQIEAAVEYAVTTYGRLDVVFSNAGMLPKPTTILDMDMAEVDKVMAVNVRGMVGAIKHGARAMVKLGIRGSIICTSSVSSVQGGFGPASYTASKHAVNGLMREAACELGPAGIRVNCVSPAGVATPMSIVHTGWSASRVEEICGASATLKGVVLKPQNIAEAALFLASDEAAFISGHNLLVDGATTAVFNYRMVMN